MTNETVLAQPQAPSGAFAAERQVFAVGGRPLVLPIVPVGGDASGWVPASVPIISFVTSERLPVQVFYVSGRAAGGDAWGWLPPTALWSAEGLDEVTAARSRGENPTSSPGFWALLIDVPRKAMGRAVRLDGKTIPIAWVDAPPEVTDAARAPRPRMEPEALRRLGEMLRPEALDPLRRWRVRLILDRLKAGALWSEAPPAFASHVLEALANQNEWRWRAAIAKLRQAGPDTAAELLARITAVVRTPWGGLLPAWPLDESELARLRATLLDARSSQEMRLDAAQAWMGEQAPVIAWVMDESAPGAAVERADAEGRVNKILTRAIAAGMTDLRGRAASAALTPLGLSAVRSLRIEGHESGVLSVDAAPPTGLDVGQVMARAGDWTGQLAFLGTALPAKPPGFKVGPLIPALNMAEWMYSAPGAMPSEWATAGLLSRSARGAWEMYVECRAASVSAEDVVRIHLGVFPSSARVIEVSAPRSAERSDRWSAMVEIPASALDDRGELRIGLERIDPRGVRSTWPRAVLPGQDQVGRVVIDVRAWGGLGRQ